MRTQRKSLAQWYMSVLLAFERLRWEDHFSSEVWDKPEERKWDLTTKTKQKVYMRKIAKNKTDAFN